VFDGGRIRSASQPVDFGLQVFHPVEKLLDQLMVIAYGRWLG
jgi:hypothetical protein